MKTFEAFELGMTAASKNLYRGEMHACPFETGSKDEENWLDGYNRFLKQEKEIKCHAPPASEDKKNGRPSGAKPKTEPSDSEDLIQLQSNIEKLTLLIASQDSRISDLTQGIEYLAQQVKTLVDALAEDQDPDAPMTHYMSGKPI